MKLQIDGQHETCEHIAQTQIRMLERTGFLSEHSLSVVKSQVKQAYNEQDAAKICAHMDAMFYAPSLF